MSKDDTLRIIAQCGSKCETVSIHYPETKNHSEGWREVEPYSLRTKAGKDGEKLEYGSDYIDDENVFYGRNCDTNDSTCHAFSIGDIQGAKATGNGFTPRWDVEF